MSCAKESTMLTPQILNYQQQKRRTLSWERIQGYVGLNNKRGTRFGLLCPRLCHWRQTLIRRTKLIWTFTRVISSRLCFSYLIRPWNAKICGQNQTHYCLTLKILSPFSFSASSYMWWLNEHGTLSVQQIPAGFSWRCAVWWIQGQIWHHIMQGSLCPRPYFLSYKSKYIKGSCTADTDSNV